MIRVAIVEDEELYAGQLREYMERFQKEKGLEISMTFFSDGDEIVEGYDGSYDIILMDIQMRFMDGMTAATRIREKDSQVIIMFITNMTQYAIRGYEVDALDYMVKPVEYFSFSEKLMRAIGRIPKDNARSVTIPVESGVVKVKLDDILYIESFGHSLVYKTAGGEYKSRGTMKELENTFTQYGFYRIAKSYLVNMKHVKGMQDGCCNIGDTSLAVSRQKKKEFMEALLSYISAGV